MSEAFNEIQEVKLQLEDFSVEQLKSLLPCATWYQEHAVRELINEKQYD